jgi:ABC-type glycerol-3-phosphate transport system permease component
MTLDTPKYSAQSVGSYRPHPFASAANTRRRGWSDRLPAPLTVLTHIVLVMGAIVMVGPLIWMVLTSLKTPADAEAFFDTPRRIGAMLRAMWPDPLRRMPIGLSSPNGP